MTDTVEEMKRLGLIVSNDHIWKAVTEKNAYARMWMVKRPKNIGANLCDLTDYLLTYQTEKNYFLIWDPTVELWHHCR